MNPERIFLQSLRDNGIAADSHFLVALSGGGDSVALLCIASACLSSTGGRISACRIAHGLRPYEDDERENRYCKELCASLNIAFSLISVPGGDMLSRANENGRGIEQQARLERHAGLEKKRCEIAADWILFGHTAEDNLETVMMRILEGAGPEGLKGIPEKRLHILRPLLKSKRDDLRRYLESRKISWLEDQSNSQPVYRRNRVRIELLPLINDIFPGWSAALATLGRRSSEVDDALERFQSLSLPFLDNPGPGRNAVRWNADSWDNAADYLKARVLWQGFNTLSSESVQDRRWPWRSVIKARAALDRSQSWSTFNLRLERRDDEIVMSREALIKNAGIEEHGIRIMLDYGEVQKGMELTLAGYCFLASFEQFPDSHSHALGKNQWPVELLFLPGTNTTKLVQKVNNSGNLPDVANELVYISVKWTG